MGNIDDKIKALEQEVESLECQKEVRELSSPELVGSKKIVTDFRSLYGMQESLRHQKSRIQSCKLGDI